MITFPYCTLQLLLDSFVVALRRIVSSFDIPANKAIVLSSMEIPACLSH